MTEIAHRGLKTLFWGVSVNLPLTIQLVYVSLKLLIMKLLSKETLAIVVFVLFVLGHFLL